MAAKRKAAAQEASRQRRLDKAKRRKKEKAQRIRARAETVTQLAEELKAQVAASGAFGMPALFRSLRLDGVPESWSSLTGLDLQMVWYESQEARNREEAAEPVSSLQVDSCERVTLREFPEAKVWEGLPDMELFRCEARLAECVAETGIYGRWLRMQTLQGVYNPSDEYAEIAFSFLIVLGKATKKVIRIIQPRLALTQPTMLVAGEMNLFDAVVLDGQVESFSELQVDRWFEMINMLRIIIPRLGRQSSENLHFLERRLEQLESEEAATAEMLRRLAAESVKLWEERRALQTKLGELRVLVENRKKDAQERLSSARAKLQALQTEKTGLEAAFKQEQSRAIDATRRKDADDYTKWKTAAEASSARLQAVKASLPEAEAQVRRRERTAMTAGAELIMQIRDLETQLQSAEREFKSACAAEAPVSKAFEFAYFRREELLAEIRSVAK